jgi:hypothetical protein
MPGQGGEVRCCCSAPVSAPQARSPDHRARRNGSDGAWGSKGKDALLLAKFCRLFSRMEKGDLQLLLFMVQKMAKRKAV